MNLRYAGECSECGREIPQGEKAFYNKSKRSVRHIDCDSELELGSAGASAMREYERRKAKDDARIAKQKENVQAVFGEGFLGKVATFLAVDDRPKRSTAVWAQGAVGEERVAEWLDRLSEVGVVALHDRRIPGTRANIDHLVVTPWGVWVVDAKRYLHKRPDFYTEGGFMGVGGTPRLTVGGRKRDELVDGVLWQVSRVKEVVSDSISVRGALAFVEADWPLLGGDFMIRDVAVLWPRRLTKVLLRQEAPSVGVDELVRLLGVKFPPA